MSDRKTRTMPAAKKPEPMMGTTQWTLLPLVQANQNSPTGSRMEPTRAGGRRASGGAIPPAFFAARW